MKGHLTRCLQLRRPGTGVLHGEIPGRALACWKGASGDGGDALASAQGCSMWSVIIDQEQSKLQRIPNMTLSFFVSLLFLMFCFFLFISMLIQHRHLALSILKQIKLDKKR